MNVRGPINLFFSLLSCCQHLSGYYLISPTLCYTELTKMEHELICITPLCRDKEVKIQQVLAFHHPRGLVALN